MSGVALAAPGLPRAPGWVNLVVLPMKARSTFPVLVVNFVNSLGYSIILPFLVFLVTRFGGNGYVYGLLAATYPSLQLVGAPLLGRWSDTKGRRRILLLSQVGTLIGWGLFLLALYLPMATLLRVRISGEWVALTLPLLVLFVARALDGLTGGNTSVANAYLADISREEDRRRNFGRMAVSGNLGFVVGPAAAGVLGSTAWGETPPVLAAVAISVVATLTIVLLLPEYPRCTPGPLKGMPVGRVLGQEPRDCFAPRKTLEFRQCVALPGVGFLLILYFLIFLGFNLFYTAFPVHAAQSLKWKVGDTGVFFSILSLMMVVVQGPVLTRVSKHVAEAPLVVVGNIILSANFVLLTSPSTPVIYLAAVLFALGNGLMWPSVLSILARVAGSEHQGAVQGIAGSCGSLASIVGLVAGGILYETIGATTFVLAGAIIFLVCILSLRLTRLAPPADTDAVGLAS